jgi:NitT/TauT family transport system permease protein
MVNSTTSTRASPAQVSRVSRSATIWVWRIAIVIFVIVGWQQFPQIPGIRQIFAFADPFFISSPSLIATQLWNLFTGAHGTAPIWAPLARSVLTALIGTTVACASGAVAGLAVSNWETLERVTRPFIVLANAVPRIAIIPVIVLLVGSSAVSDAVTAFTVVFFVVFYNAFEGSSTVPIEVIQNAELLGASRLAVMWKVRWPYALAWTMAALPNAIAFGLIGSVTAEIFTGSAGLGWQLTLAIDNANATLLFSTVMILAVVGVILVLGSSSLRQALLPWWESNQGQ